MSVMHAQLECQRTGTKPTPVTCGGRNEDGISSFKTWSTSTQRCETTGGKIKTTTTQCWNISRDEDPIKVIKVQASGISVDVDDQGDLIALYTQLSNEYNRREREGGRDS